MIDQSFPQAISTNPTRTQSGASVPQFKSNNPVISSNDANHYEAEKSKAELVMAYGPDVPPQLEHWLKKRNINLLVRERVQPDIHELRAQRPAFVVIDVDAATISVEALRLLRQQVPQEIKIIAVTARSDESYTRMLVEAGACGVVVKRPYVADIVFAVQAASEGKVFITGHASERERLAIQVTSREREVLDLMANGYSNQAIGERLSISVKTVEAHRARLFKKLGASNVADAVLLAIRTGLVTP